MYALIVGKLGYFLSDFGGYLVFFAISLFIFVVGIYKTFKNKYSEKRKEMLVTGLFTFIAVVSIFTFCEAFFRYRYDQTDGLGFLKVSKRWNDRHVRYNNMIYRDDKNYEIDKPAGVTRIGVFGDSLTFAQGIKNVSDRYSNQLETMLKQNGKNVQVYNFGISGQDTCEEINQFRKLEYIPMDIIIWQYYFNDIQPCNDQSTGTRIMHNTLGQISPVIRYLSNVSFFFDYMYWRLTPNHDAIYHMLRNADLAQYDTKSIFDQHVIDIATLSGQMKHEGVKEGNPPRKVIAIAFPLLNLFDKNYPGADVQKKMVAVLAAQDMEVIDMYPFLKDKKREDLVVGHFDSHPNEYVNKIAAEKLEEKILPLLP